MANMLKQTIVILLALVAVGVSADECDVSLLQSPEVTYIKTNSGSSIIQVTSSDEWQAYTVSQSEKKITNANGDINQDVSPAEAKPFEDKITDLAPTAVNNFGSRGRKLELASTDGQRMVASFSNGTHLLSAANGDLAAFGLDRTLASGQKIRSIFLQNSTVVSYVKESCEVVTMPLDKLDAEVQQLLDELAQNATTDGEMHILPFQPSDQMDRFARPPPPPPHGGPFGPHPPHGGPFGPHPPPPPPHGGPFGPHPPHGGPFGPQPRPPQGPFGPYSPQLPFGGRPEQPPSFPAPEGSSSFGQQADSWSQNNGYPSGRAGGFGGPSNNQRQYLNYQRY